MDFIISGFLRQVHLVNQSMWHLIVRMSNSWWQSSCVKWFMYLLSSESSKVWTWNFIISPCRDLCCLQMKGEVSSLSIISTSSTSWCSWLSCERWLETPSGSWLGSFSRKTQVVKTGISVRRHHYGCHFGGVAIANMSFPVEKLFFINSTSIRALPAHKSQSLVAVHS